jgi:acetyl-CoA synthetase (ADP-forming)
MTTQPDMAGRAALLPPLARDGGRPLVYVMSAGAVGDAARAAMRDADFPFFDRVGDALAVIRALDAAAAGRVAPPAPVRPHGMVPPPALPVGPLTEGEAKRLVAACGIAITREAAARSADEAVAAAEVIGYPAVLKGVSRAVVHKSDAGLVRLDLRDAAALRAAFAEVSARLGPQAEGCVVQDHVRGAAELFLGATHDPQFGPMVMVGAGGVLVEVLQDLRMAAAPVSRAQARAMIGALRIAPVLEGLRGQPADIDAAAAALERLSWLAADLGPRLVTLDINPLVLCAAGQGAIAVDARATLAKEETP